MKKITVRWFVVCISDALRQLSGINVEKSIAHFVSSYGEIAVTSGQRENALRKMFASELTEQDVRRLLALRPNTGEAVTFARAILTGVTWTFGRHRESRLSHEQLVRLGFVSLLVALHPDEDMSPDENVGDKQDPSRVMH